MMSKASRIILLCEDKLQKVVVTRFLTKGCDVDPRDIKSIIAPKGKGSGESYMRKKYPENLKAYRSRQARTILIAVIDADAETVARHHRELDDACRSKSIDPRQVGEAVLHVIPKHHIETWLAYLDGRSVDETENYKLGYQFKGRESDCHSLVDGLADKCKSNSQLIAPPSSLNEACVEFGRIRVLL